MLQDIITPQQALFSDGVQTILRGHENRSRRVVLLKGNLVQNSRSDSRGISARVTKNGRYGFSSTADYTEEGARVPATSGKSRKAVGSVTVARRPPCGRL